MEHRLR